MTLTLGQIGSLRIVLNSIDLIKRASHLERHSELIGKLMVGVAWVDFYVNKIKNTPSRYNSLNDAKRFFENVG